MIALPTTPNKLNIIKTKNDMKTEISNLEIIKAAKEFSEDKNKIRIENIGAYLGFKAGAKYVLNRLQTKNSNMFSA